MRAASLGQAVVAPPASTMANLMRAASGSSRGGWASSRGRCRWAGTRRRQRRARGACSRVRSARRSGRRGVWSVRSSACAWPSTLACARALAGAPPKVPRAARARARSLGASLCALWSARASTRTASSASRALPRRSRAQRRVPSVRSARHALSCRRLTVSERAWRQSGPTARPWNVTCRQPVGIRAQPVARRILHHRQLPPRGVRLCMQAPRGGPMEACPPRRRLCMQPPWRVPSGGGRPRRRLCTARRPPTAQWVRRVAYAWAPLTPTGSALMMTVWRAPGAPPPLPSGGISRRASLSCCGGHCPC